MYMMHDAVIKSSVKARGLVTLYMSPCVDFNVHTFSIIAHLTNLLCLE